MYVECRNSKVFRYSLKRRWLLSFQSSSGDMMKSAMVSGPHHLKVVLKARLPSTGFMPKKRERIFGGSSYRMSCVEEVLAIGLLKKLLTFVGAKDTYGFIFGLLRVLTLLNTSTRRVVLNSLNNTKEYSGGQRLTNSDLNCHLNSLHH